MSTATHPHRSPLGLFPGKPAPRLYDRIVEVLRVRHYSRRIEGVVRARRPKRLHVLNRGGRGIRSPADVLAHRPEER
ncbi:MAG TPA: hypothetical protein VML55_20775 [Planctomycetaceae bacterium]|nr:hypothetical protein [Planctomycetaceae bacterium]